MAFTLAERTSEGVNVAVWLCPPWPRGFAPTVEDCLLLDDRLLAEDGVGAEHDNDF